MEHNMMIGLDAFQELDNKSVNGMFQPATQNNQQKEDDDFDFDEATVDVQDDSYLDRVTKDFD